MFKSPCTRQPVTAVHIGTGLQIVAVLVQIDNPEALRPVGTASEWNELRAVVATRQLDMPCPAMTDDVMAHDTLFLRPHEAVMLPFALQVFKTGLPAEPTDDDPASEMQALRSAGYDGIRQICVQMISQSSGQMVRTPTLGHIWMSVSDGRHKQT
jgi:hypothetical protein